MSKMNHRRGGKGARRGKECRSWCPESIIRATKKLHVKALRRAGKVEISIQLAVCGDYVPELKPRDCFRKAKKSPRAAAYWIVF